MAVGEGCFQGVLDQGSVNQLGIRHDQIRTTTHLSGLIGIQGVRNPLYLVVAPPTPENFSNDLFSGLPCSRIDVIGKPLVAESTGRGETGDFLQQFLRSNEHRIRCATATVEMRQPTPMS